MRATTLVPIAVLMLAPALGGASPPPSLSEQGGIRWACGGIGADERRALAAIGRGTNLEATFVSAKRGSYLSGAELTLYQGNGTTPVLQVVAEGPQCFIDAPAGSYRVQARLGGVERTRTVRLSKPGVPGARAVFTFPDEPWDGIRASDEEKRQAREP